MKIKKNILLAAFLLFIAFQAFFIFKRVHNYPFMIYDMYSRPEQKHTSSKQYLIVAGKDTVLLSDLPLMLEGRILKSLKIYESNLVNGADPWSPALNSRIARIKSLPITNRMQTSLVNKREHVDAYPMWLKDFLERKVLRRSISGLEVYSNTIELQNGSVIQSRKLIDL
ncbi:MAG: hypothetical protein GY751_04755 [Bacteroidetes bacterium]|nr:hypothetical protein [Bacteroidota bacterium]